jgi:hypothetical protein
MLLLWHTSASSTCQSIQDLADRQLKRGYCVVETRPLEHGVNLPTSRMSQVIAGDEGVTWVKHDGLNNHGASPSVHVGEADLHTRYANPGASRVEEIQADFVVARPAW